MPFKTLEDFLSLFGDYENGSSGRYKVRCPAHADGEDRERWSLSIYQDHEKILLKCFAGCTTEQIVAAKGLTVKDLFLDDPTTQHSKSEAVIECTYDYTDETGKLLFQVVRYKPKNFKQRRPDGNGGWVWNLKGIKPVIYRLPEVLDAIQKGKAVFICEGEKDVDNLRAIGCIATTSPMGAGKWHDEYNNYFAGAKVIVIPDNDEPGRKHAAQVCRSLQGKASQIFMLTLPGEGVKDASNWIEQGGTKDKLRELLADLEEWQPSKEIIESQEKDNLPFIETQFQRLRDKTNVSIEALLKANNPPTIFVRSGQLVRISQDEHGLPVIEIFVKQALRGKLERSANYYHISGKGNNIPDPPPVDVVDDLLSLGKWPFPPLIGITESPAIRIDGSILIEPGYDSATELYYIPASSLKVPTIPEIIDTETIQKAKNLLLEIICDFPFEDDSSKANAVAAMITPVLRPLINGPIPMVLFDKPQAGTGASLLADVTSLIATGRTSAMLTAPKEDEDWRKLITSLLMEGKTIITVDNIEGRFYSVPLCILLTGETWQDRILGRSEMITLPHRAVWIGTGNNIKLGGDLPRRCYYVKMDAKEARPWQRKNFKHPELTQWVKENRGEILISILILAKAWIQAGKPKAEKLPTMGGFESWIKIVGNILNYAGINGFLDNLERLYEDSDEDTPQWEGFIGAWHEIIGEEFYTVPDLVKKFAEQEKVKEVLPSDLGDDLKDKGFTRKLGKALSRRSGVRFSNGLVIQKGKVQHKAVTWAIKTKDWNPDELQLDLTV